MRQGKKYPARFLPRAIKKEFPKLLTVSDALAPVQITVTSRDVKVGRKKDPEHCALAQACLRQQKVDGAVIRLSSAFIVKGNHATRFMVPQSVKREIISFDRHHDFRPGVYWPSAVGPSARLGLKRKRTKGTHAKKYRFDGTILSKKHFTLGVR